LSYDHRLTQILGLRFAIAKAKVRAAYWNIGILPVSAEDSRLKAHWAHWLKKPMFQFSAWHTLRSQRPLWCFSLALQLALAGLF